ncbi:UMP kinase [Oceanivirga miroungae]|uniref:Uridylate kinase n=1 Tax=Oceanivirga miroungae TaxID=1130046 RepID=A0A6I8MA96_9FUSO|nr:UMP kinase [Oceanivirga miroungae]VWL85750.1 uridylate kinase [Oceanivirga miroungae]
MKYKRILLKLSGESLAGEKENGYDEKILLSFAKQIKQLHSKGVQVAIVIGGGNLFRGLSGTDAGIDRATGDTMGMLATIMNGLALQNFIESQGVPTRVMTSISMEEVAEPYIRRRAIRHLEKGRIVIFSGGTGMPYFTTDSGGAIRSIEIHADILAKGTKVDGIYDKDPMKYEDAKKYDEISYEEAIVKNLKVMDATALSLCRENKMPIIVFDATKEGNMLKLVEGYKIGTIVK